MPRGGARPGAGRKRKLHNALNMDIIKATEAIPVELLAAVMRRLPRGSRALQAIQAIYDDPDTPVEVRLKLYALALPFEVGKPARVTAEAQAAPTAITIATGVPRAAVNS